jgi:hypothetical protein
MGYDHDISEQITIRPPISTARTPAEGRSPDLRSGAFGRDHERLSVVLKHRVL